MKGALLIIVLGRQCQFGKLGHIDMLPSVLVNPYDGKLL